MNNLRILFEQLDEEETGGIGVEKEEEKTDSTTLGRVFVLKNLYSKLLSINSFLKNTQDTDVENIRYLNREAIELFELVIQNIDEYREQLDDIIYQYYKFIEKMCKVLQKHFKKERKKSHVSKRVSTKQNHA